MRTAAIINQKGGCGKTTTAINLSGIFARRGARTLLVDMDPQSHCAAGLAIPEKRIDLDIGDAMVLEPARRLEPSRLVWRVSRNLDLAPSRMKLAGLEAKRGGLVDKPDCDRRLRGVLEQLAGSYDVCVIDCSPSIGLLTYNAMIAADAVLIPVETSFFSLQGASKQIASIETLNKRLGTSLPHWLVPTIHDPSSPLAKDLLEELRRRFADRVVPQVIRQDPAVREAASFGLPVVDYAPDSSGASDHAGLAEWVSGHLGVELPEALPEPEAIHHQRPHETSRLIDADQPDPAARGDAGETRHEVRVRSTPEGERELARRVARGGAEHAPPAPETGEPDHAGGAASSASGSGSQDSSADQSASQPAVDEPLVSRAEDMFRRACALQRRREGLGTPVHLEPGSSEPDWSLARRPTTTPRPSVRALLGARPTTSGALFIQPLSAGTTIAIAGTFNEWSATSHVMRANPELGVFELCIQLPPGRHAYRLVVDGHWMTDPHNEVCESNPFGGTNSIIVIPHHPRSASVHRPPSTAAERISHD